MHEFHAKDRFVKTVQATMYKAWEKIEYLIN